MGMVYCLRQGGDVTIRIMSEREQADDMKQGEVRVKVTDRRKFDSLGERREDSAPEADLESEVAPPPAPESRPPAEAAADAPGQPDEAPGQPASGPTEDPGSTGERDHQTTDGKREPGQVDFQSFVYFLYMSALHELGIPTQEGAEPRPADLERARFFVEVLQLLEGKTKGNLEPGETKLLEEALYNLRMQYVGISQNTPS